MMKGCRTRKNNKIEEKIYRRKDKIIIEIPFWKKTRDIYGNLDIHPRLIGIIEKHDWGEDMGFAKIISLPYKGGYGYTEIKYHFWEDKEKFKKLCKELGVEVVEFDERYDC